MCNGRTPTLRCNGFAWTALLHLVDSDRILDALEEIAELETLDPVELLSGAENIRREKWDWALPEEMARWSFASLCLDFVGAKEAAYQLRCG